MWFLLGLLVLIAPIILFIAFVYVFTERCEHCGKKARRKDVIGATTPKPNCEKCKGKGKYGEWLEGHEHSLDQNTPVREQVYRTTTCSCSYTRLIVCSGCGEPRVG